ncbi:TraB/GumN family protein [Rurimicrobium arvi]|uniref:TraB/GumN family protein n=1 Tax=Rurimicrobium arvi TaxID=2049916 RepID=A0ABP8MWF7_9BACT
MKTLHIIIFSLLFAVTISHAKNNEGLLWRISSADGKQTSFLFGTIHIICPEDYFWTKSMQASFEKCSRVCFEMNIADPGLMTEASMQLMDFSGKTLRDYFRSDAAYEAVAAYIRDTLHQELSIAERMKPIGLYFLYSTLSVSSPCKQDPVSYEMKLLESAQNKHIEVAGLETLSEQLEAISTIPTDSIITLLTSVARGEKDDQQEMKALINAYKQQDLALLQQMLEQESKESGFETGHLIDDRNRKWIAPMKQMMSDGNTFFAVGAGHLKGLISLLRKEGYQVIAVE